MTADRARLRARLASALDGGGDIETRSISEVRAALAEQGIDPTASIRLARKLARGSVEGDPSARLLQQIEQSETVDAEIAALEEADIEDIKAALPPGIGRSDRSPSTEGPPPAEVTPVEPRRRRLSRRPRLSTLGWGGSLIGIAASVLVFIAVRPDRLDRPGRLEQADAPLSSIEARPPVAGDAESADVVSEDALSRAEEPEQDLALELSRIQGKASAGSDRYAAGQADLADAEGEALVAGAGRRVLQRLDENAAQPLVESRERVLAEETELDLASGVTVSKMEPPSEPAELLAILADLKAVLLVDEARAPVSLRTLSNRLPAGRLAAKLGEAERRASGGKVVALVAFARDGEIVEAALVEAPTIRTVPDLSGQTATGVATFAEGDPAAPLRSEVSFKLIDLSAGR